MIIAVSNVFTYVRLYKKLIITSYTLTYARQFSTRTDYNMLWVILMSNISVISSHIVP